MNFDPVSEALEKRERFRALGFLDLGIGNTSSAFPKIIVEPLSDGASRGPYVDNVRGLGRSYIGADIARELGPAPPKPFPDPPCYGPFG